MPDFDDLRAGDDVPEAGFSETVQAAMDVLEDCYAELTVLDRRLRDEELDPALDLGDEELPSLAAQSARVAARLEACAGALREASDASRS